MDILKSIFKGKDNIVILIDGPNIIRKSFNIDLSQVKREVSKYGNIRVSKVYLDQFASDKLIEAMVNQGFDTVITTGDVDVTMAIEGMEYLMDKDIDILALVTRDTDYRPLLIKAKEKGKKTIIVATDTAFSVALKNTADIVIIIKNSNESEHSKNV